MADKDKKIDWDAEAEKLKKPEGLNELIETIAASEKLTKKELLQKAKEALYSFHGLALLEPYLPSDAELTKEIIEKAVADFEEENGITIKNAIIRELQKQRKAEAVKAKKITYPVDNINTKLWREFSEIPPNQMTFMQNSEEIEVKYVYQIDFSEIEERTRGIKKLDFYDKRLYIAVGALYNAGNQMVTPSQIYEAMGYTTKPNKNTLKKINDSLTKLMNTRILIDNVAELQNGKDYKRFDYDGALLAGERLTEKNLNGEFENSIINLLREPPLLTFAKERKQVTTLNIKVLQSSISKTEANLEIEDYLQIRIARMKKGKAAPTKILFSTVYENLGIAKSGEKDRKKRERLPGRIDEYLSYYKSIGFIKNYKIDKEFVQIFFEENQLGQSFD